MKYSKLFFTLIIVFSSISLFSQTQVSSYVEINNLVKVNEKFSLRDSFPKLYTGNAFDLFPGNDSIRFFWKIKDGIVISFIKYSESGNVITEENYDYKGVYSGKYLLANEKGDTLLFGNYKNGKKDGKWLTTNSKLVKIYIYYKNGILIRK